MASGKSSIGRRVAKQLGVPFVDSDKVFVAEHGVIADYFTSHGEQAFRDREADVVEALLLQSRADLASGQPSVIALGGGAIVSERTRANLADAHIVLVMTTEEAVLGRSNLSSRPLLANDPGAWSRILAERLPLYKQLASATFDTSRLPKDQIANSITAWVEAGCQPDESSTRRNGHDRINA
nr:shikimate kinase [Lysinibacter cavernae]